MLTSCPGNRGRYTFGQGAVPFQHGESHLGFERRGVIPSGPFHSLLSFPGHFLVPSSRAEFSLNRLSYFAGPALSGTTREHDLIPAYLSSTFAVHHR